MRQKKLQLIAVLLSGLGLTGVHAQESLNASGGNANGSGGTASYTVGQIACQTYTGSYGSVSQGVQQTYEISTVTGIHETMGISLSVSAYPNPAKDYLTIAISDPVQTSHGLSPFTYHLYNQTGNLLQTKKITTNQIIIDMNHFSPSTYFLKITDNKREVKNFKIVKN